MSESSVSFTLIYTTQSVKSISAGETSTIMWANRPQCRRHDLKAKRSVSVRAG